MPARYFMDGAIIKNGSPGPTGNAVQMHVPTDQTSAVSSLCFL